MIVLTAREQDYLVSVGCLVSGFFSALASSFFSFLSEESSNSNLKILTISIFSDIVTMILLYLQYNTHLLV